MRFYLSGGEAGAVGAFRVEAWIEGDGDLDTIGLGDGGGVVEGGWGGGRSSGVPEGGGQGNETAVPGGVGAHVARWQVIAACAVKKEE